MTKNNRGFTLIEIMFVVGIIGLLAPLAMLSFTVARERSQETACLENRRVIEGVEQQFQMSGGRHSATLYELIDAGYVKWDGLCPANGIYAWVPYPEDNPRYHSLLGCSIHGSSSLKKTSSGISDNFDDLNSDGWKQVGNWQVTSQGTYASYGSTKAGTYQRSYFNEQELTDFDVSVKGILATGSGSFGLLFRMNYNESKPQQANGYALVIEPRPTRQDPNRTLVTIKDVKNGKLGTTRATIWRSGSLGGASYEQEHELRVSAQGNTFIGYVDGQQVIRYTDANNRYTSGAAGLGVDKGSATFDDFQITYRR